MPHKAKLNQSDGSLPNLGAFGFLTLQGLTRREGLRHFLLCDVESSMQRKEEEQECLFWTFIDLDKNLEEADVASVLSSLQVVLVLNERDH